MKFVDVLQKLNEEESFPNKEKWAAAVEKKFPGVKFIFNQNAHVDKPELAVTADGIVVGSWFGKSGEIEKRSAQESAALLKLYKPMKR